MTSIQKPESLDRFYESPDPWGYRNSADDERRRSELLAALPPRRYQRGLDIGCGNGFVTFSLPAEHVLGADVSAKAIEWAERERGSQPRPDRFTFLQSSLFELDRDRLGTFDLIVVTGVLYKQYIGKGSALVRLLVDGLLRQGGILASCHIREWSPPAFPYDRLDTSVYPYRDYAHQLEIYEK
jgi:predicted TPR repeat methyltransferase